jgi:hypothetical protein
VELINYGIKTGCNEAFIIDGATRARLIAADPKSAEIIRSFLICCIFKNTRGQYYDLWLHSRKQRQANGREPAV